MQQWYAVFSKPRQEAVAEVNLARQGFEVWLPKIQHSRHRAGRWVKLVEPLFPRYLFIRLRRGEDDFSPIRSTRGVSGLVRVGMQPATIPQAVLDRLQASVDQRTGLLVPRAMALEPGDRVEVVEGPCRGLEGIFQARSGADRVTILLDILGRANRVNLSRHQVIATH